MNIRMSHSLLRSTAIIYVDDWGHYWRDNAARIGGMRACNMMGHMYNDPPRSAIRHREFDTLSTEAIEIL